jgi:hypothetical protein
MVVLGGRMSKLRDLPEAPPSVVRHVRGEDTERVKRVVAAETQSMAGVFEKQFSKKLVKWAAMLSIIGTIVTGAGVYYSNLGKKVSVEDFKALAEKVESTSKIVAEHDGVLRDIRDDVHFIKEHMFEGKR